MKKVILLLDPENNCNKATIDTACSMAMVSGSETKSRRVSQNKIIARDHSLSSININAFTTSLKYYSRLFQTSEAPKSFARKDMDEDYGQAIIQIIEESDFSDFLIIDPAIMFTNPIEMSPSTVAKHIMRHALCPVILAQAPLHHQSEIIFTYNGSKNSVCAIKQFTYLFPGFAHNHITILETNITQAICSSTKIKLLDWTNHHYSNVTYHTLPGNIGGTLSHYLSSRANAFVVMGAYNRQFVLRLLKSGAKNSTSEFINNTLFITLV